MNYTHLHLDELGISSDEEAEELEYELDLRFEDFTPDDRTTWLKQNAYLDHFSHTGTVTSAAKKAGVTVFTAQRWQYDNILGFTRRLEVAVLTFNDRLKEKALLRASDPNAPATLLIELLRAYVPEEFSRDGHKCDSSKSEEVLRRFSEDAGRELEAGHPKLRKMAEGAENAHPVDDWQPSNSDLSPVGGETQRGRSSHPVPNPHEPVSPDDNYHTDMNDYPAEPVSPDYTPPLGESDDYQHDRPTPNRHSRASGNPENPSASSAPSAVNPSPFSTSTQNPAPRTSAPSRAQLRQQRKEQKKNTFPVKRF